MEARSRCNFVKAGRRSRWGVALDPAWLQGPNVMDAIRIPAPYGALGPENCFRRNETSLNMFEHV